MLLKDFGYQVASLGLGILRLGSAARTTLGSLGAGEGGLAGVPQGSLPMVDALPAVWEGGPPADYHHGGIWSRSSSDGSANKEDSSLLAGSEVFCSKSQPCQIGCCGLIDSNGQGQCGSGPRYCGQNCTSGCSWKSQCDPGWGMQYSAASKCPLNACCSQYGFCGTTEAFCKDDKVKRPSCLGGSNANKRRIGYYEGWNLSKSPCGKTSPEQIPTGYYSHINLAFAHIDPVTSRIAKSNETASMYRGAQALKSKQPNLKIWISIGSGAMAQAEPYTNPFSHMASQDSSRVAFLDSLLEMMDESSVDGVDLNWEYPTDAATGGKAEDFENLVMLCQMIRERFGARGRGGLSITLPAPYTYMKGYKLKELEKYVDWFNFMTYDLHGEWEKDTPTLENRAYAHTNLTEIELQMDMLWRNRVDPGKIVMGLAFYGRSFTMADARCKDAGCTFREAGRPGKCTQRAGLLSVVEILELAAAAAAQQQQQKHGEETMVKFDREAAVKTMAWGKDQWVSYDDAETLRMKMEYANSRCLAGTMIWSIDMDDGRLTEDLLADP